MTGAEPLPKLPPRDPKGHKGTFGTVAVVGGCALADSRMIGGPALTALAALRSGAGLARLVMPETVLNFGLTIAPVATGLAMPVDGDGALIPHEASRIVDEALTGCAALAIGPGLGQGAGAAAAALRAVVQEERPVVVDADALNVLSEMPELRQDFHAHAVITPHPGEFRRLAKALGVLRDESDAVDEARRPDAAARLAQTLGAVVVLKGHRTVVSDGHRSWTSETGNAALATGGSGDVLTGMIAALIAQHHRDPILAGSRTVTSEQRGGLGLFDCARLAVHAHGLAADQWVAEAEAGAGMLATDLLERIPAALETLRASPPGGISSSA